MKNLDGEKRNTMMPYIHGQSQHTNNEKNEIWVMEVRNNAFSPIPRFFSGMALMLVLFCELFQWNLLVNVSRLWLSADTKEERMQWCSKLNEALENVRTWHSDALRPIRHNDMVTPYNPYPSKADKKDCIVPFNPQDQQSTC